MTRIKLEHVLIATVSFSLGIGAGYDLNGSGQQYPGTCVNQTGNMLVKCYKRLDTAEPDQFYKPSGIDASNHSERLLVIREAGDDRLYMRSYREIEGNPESIMSDWWFKDGKFMYLNSVGMVEEEPVKDWHVTPYSFRFEFNRSKGYNIVDELAVLRGEVMHSTENDTVTIYFPRYYRDDSGYGGYSFVGRSDGRLYFYRYNPETDTFENSSRTVKASDKGGLGGKR